MVGAKPSYRKEHILKALLILDKKRTGRKKLVKKMGLGEGSVRTILKKLKEEELITSVKQGHSLTEKGSLILANTLKKFTRPETFETFDLACGSPKAMSIIKDASAKVGKGMDQRDTAVKAGADGALILACKDGELQFPSGGIGLDELGETKRKVEALPLSEGDVVAIVFAQEELQAEDGLLAVIMDLANPEII